MKENIESGMQSRYDMSFFTFRQLQRDHIRFMEEFTDSFKNEGAFISRILVNYMCYAQENERDSFEARMREVLDSGCHEESYADERLNINMTLADKMNEFAFKNHPLLKKRTVISAMLREFAAMTVAKREMIYSYEQYKLINAAISESNMLMVSISSGKEYEVKPYDIAVDENSLSYYLIGYSRLLGTDAQFECHSFKLNRIKECRRLYQEFMLTAKEMADARGISEQFGYAYIARNLTAREIEKTVVRLTSKGYNRLFLKIIAHQRPIPSAPPIRVEVNGEEYFELEFNCSHEQIHTYFFPFGAEAEIISPTRTRERFIKEYTAAVERYGGKDVISC